MSAEWTNIIKWIVRYGDSDDADMEELDDLLEQESGSIKTSTQNTVLHFSAICKSSCCLKKFLQLYPSFLNARNDKGETPLHWACLEGNMANIKLLIRAGANTHMVDCDNNSILHFAVQNGNQRATKYILRKSLCDIHLQNIFGQSAFFVACQEREFKIMKILVLHGANTGIMAHFPKDKKLFRSVQRYIQLAC